MIVPIMRLAFRIALGALALIAIVILASLIT